MHTAFQRIQLQAVYGEMDEYASRLDGAGAEIVASCAAIVSEYMEAQPVPFVLTEDAFKLLAQ